VEAAECAPGNQKEGEEERRHVVVCESLPSQEGRGHHRHLVGVLRRARARTEVRGSDGHYAPLVSQV
jgi:hypothetical protein